MNSNDGTDEVAFVTDKDDPAFESFQIKSDNKRVKDRRVKTKNKAFQYRRVDERIVDVHAITDDEEVEKI